MKMIDFKDITYTIFRFICRVALIPFVGIKVFGRENIPEKGGFLIAANHRSYLDPVIIGVSCPRRLNYMAKAELFKNRIYALILKYSLAFPVKRGSTDLSAFKESIRRVRRGKGLLIFPEGTRQINGRFADPEPGVGFLAAKLNVPVIPAFVDGTDKALPHGAKFIRPAVITVRFGEHISVERRMPYRNTAAQIMGSIRHLSCRVSD